MIQTLLLPLALCSVHPNVKAFIVLLSEPRRCTVSFKLTLNLKTCFVESACWASGHYSAVFTECSLLFACQSDACHEVIIHYFSVCAHHLCAFTSLLCLCISLAAALWERNAQPRKCKHACLAHRTLSNGDWGYTLWCGFDVCRLVTLSFKKRPTSFFKKRTVLVFFFSFSSDWFWAILKSRAKCIIAIERDSVSRRNTEAQCFPWSRLMDKKKPL